MAQPEYMRANGNINICCFVVMDPTAPAPGGTSSGNNVIQATLNQPTVGIADIAGAIPPILPYVENAPVLAAQAGQNVRIHGIGVACDLVVGASAVAAGNELQSDANGNGVPVAIDGKGRIGAIAITGGNPGELIKVQVVRYDKYGSPS